MNTIKRAKISAVERYVPPRLLTNFDLEKMIDTTNEWILERTGIRERHLVDKGVAASDLAVGAVENLVERHGVRIDDVEAIVVGTVTPDMMYPSTACLVQHKLKLPKAWGFDVSAGCSGFLYALTAGAKLIESGTHKKVLVIGADVNSSMIDYTDRATCIIFGDGAGAVLLEPAADGEEHGIIDFVHQIEGFGGQFLYMPGGGSLNPASHKTVDDKMHYVHQDGQQVFKYAVKKMAEMTERVLAQQWPDRRGRGLLYRPPGQQAHHLRHRRPAEDGAGQGHHQYRPLRQYYRRNHSAGHDHGHRRKAPEEETTCCCWPLSAPASPAAPRCSVGLLDDL